MKTGWQEVSVGTISVSVPSDWRRELGSGLVYEGRRGRFDARTLPDGDLVDPARVLALEKTLPGHDAGGLRLMTPPVLVLVRGRPAVRTLLEQGSTRTLVYVIGDRTRSVDGFEVSHPEIRLVFMLDDRCEVSLPELIGRMEDRSPGFEEALRRHPRTEEGHLAFTPILAPPGWAVVLDDGTRAPLGEDRILSIGGGYLMLEPLLLTPGLREGAMLRPLALAEAPLAIARDEVLHGVLRALEAKGFATVIESNALVEVAFVDAAVVRQVARLSGDLGVGRRVAYVWRDVLGYDWELAFTIRAEEQHAWKPLFTRMESRASRPG